MTLRCKTVGRLIAVVGPSGVGKDSVIAGLQRRIPDFHLVRRVITRAPELGGEVYDSVSVAQFHALVQDGAFALHWHAHGLHYGIPVTVQDQLDDGTDCLINCSRTALKHASSVFPRLTVLNITANQETLTQRLAARGRETKEEMSRRLSESAKPLPEGLKVLQLTNDGPLSETIARAAMLLQPASV